MGKTLGAGIAAVTIATIDVVFGTGPIAAWPYIVIYFLALIALELDDVKR